LRASLIRSVTLSRLNSQLARLPWLGALLLGLIVLGTWLFVFVWAKRVTTFGPDETLYVSIANWLPHHLPGGLFEFDFYQRGTQRLEVFILAATLEAFGSPGGFTAANVVNTLAFASAAIPVYLIARGVGVRQWLALLGALLTVAVPWNVLATGWLTEPVAYPAFAWSLWATWRAVDDPRPATQLRAVAFAFVALLCRSIFLVLLALLPLSVLAQELRFGSLRRSVFDLRAFARRNAVVIGLVLVGVFALALSVIGVLPPTGKLTGQYGTKLTFDVSQVLTQDSFWASRAVVGIGFIPWAIGGAWIVARVLRPHDPRLFGLAFVLLLSVALLAYASKPIPGVPTYVDERYMMYLAPVIVTAFVVALDRRDLWVPAVVIAGLFGAWLVWRQPWDPAGQPTQFFVAPAEEFYARIGLLKMQGHVPSGMSLRDWMFALFAVASLLAAYAMSRWRGSSAVGVVLIAGLVLVQLAQGQYAIAKYVNGAGGRYQATLDQRAWIDKALDGKPGDAGIFTAGVGGQTYYDFIWHGEQFWNRRVTSAWGYGGVPITRVLGDAVEIFAPNPTTGRLPASRPLPDYLVLPRDFVPSEPAGEPIVRPAYNGLDLWKVGKPNRASFIVSGTELDGAVHEETPAKIRFFAAQPPGRRCATVPIQAASAAAGPSPTVPYRIGPKRGKLAPGQQLNVEVPLEFRGKPYVDMPVEVKGKTQVADGRTYAARLLVITFGPCSGG
jgi:hypothetical protein